MRRLAPRAAVVAYLAVCLSLITAAPAAAYIDPGSGSLIFQAVIGGIMAVGVGLATFWRRIMNFFSRRDR